MFLGVFRRDSLSSAVFWAFAVAGFFVIFLNICIIDDGYITFRVVDNFVNGYGLRWNVDERVQSYTNPLWMLLHIPFHAVFGNIYWETIALSVFFGVWTVALLLKLEGGNRLNQVLLVILPLLLSRTFRNFVVCGLENPLSFFLLAWILLETLGPREKFNYYRFCLAIALSIVTRLDNIVVLLPLFLGMTWWVKKEIRWGRLLLAFSPAVAWYGFSLFYYGFLFPNTKYAKIAGGIPAVEYVQQGMHYLWNFVWADPIAFLWICGGLYFCLRQSAAVFRSRFDMGNGDTRLFLLGAGCLLHIAYVIYLGGDFMPGRFFANVFIIAVGVVAFVKPLSSPKKSASFAIALFLAAAANHGILQPNLPDRRNHLANHGIDDQHDYYYSTNGLRSDRNRFFRIEPNHPWIAEGREMTARAEKGDAFVVSGCGGMKFYYAGPKVVVIDTLGLADALIARLPVVKAYWRIGHVDRIIPAGYERARATGDTSGMDPDLARYYEKLRLVISGKLWDKDRLLAIIGFQLGFYDIYRNRYLERLKEQKKAP